MGLKHPWGIPSIILGIIVFLMGLLPLLSGFFPVPAILNTLVAKLAMYLFAALGFYLVIEDLFGQGYGMMFKWLPMGIGFLFLALGVINILSNFGVIAFAIPGLPEVVYQALFVLLGMALFFRCNGLIPF